MPISTPVTLHPLGSKEFGQLDYGVMRHAFINSTLTPEQRRDFEVEMDRWHEQDPSDKMFRETMVGLLRDWGSWLDLALYTEAICHILGGAERTLRPVVLAREGVILGNQPFHLLTSETAFRLTALTGGTEEFERNLVSLLRVTPLRGIQWINLARGRVEFISLVK